MEEVHSYPEPSFQIFSEQNRRQRLKVSMIEWDDKKMTYAAIPNAFPPAQNHWVLEQMMSDKHLVDPPWSWYA